MVEDYRHKRDFFDDSEIMLLSLEFFLRTSRHDLKLVLSALSLKIVLCYH